jgi:hypothetical protein
MLKDFVTQEEAKIPKNWQKIPKSFLIVGASETRKTFIARVIGHKPHRSSFDLSAVLPDYHCPPVVIGQK